MESSLAGGIGVEGVLLQMDQANADNFHIIDNERITSQTRDAVLVDLNDSPSDGITIHGNRIGADNPVDIDFVVDGDTFSQPFMFTNDAENGEFVSRIFIDIAPAGLEFDEDPVTGRPFNPLQNTEQCGATPEAFGTCLEDSIVTDTTLDLEFSEYTPGETFIWEIDLDLAGGFERTITGADMIGTEITFEFNDGKVISGVMVGVPGRSDASMFSQSAGDGGANGIHIIADNSPVSNLLVEQNTVSGTAGSSFILDTTNRSDISGLSLIHI